MSIECERKYCGVEFAELRQRLGAAGAVCEGAHFEHNSVWDTPAGDLRRTERLLRLRTQQWPDRQRHVLTLKLKAADSKGCKMREERELTVQDAATMESVLRGLGYTVSLCYEKVREVWHFPELEVVLDHLPFADVAELEGPAEAIDRRAAQLVLPLSAATTANYHTLHTAWRAAQGLPPQWDFVFAAPEREALLHALREGED